MRPAGMAQAASPPGWAWVRPEPEQQHQQEWEGSWDPRGPETKAGEQSHAQRGAAPQGAGCQGGEGGVLRFRRNSSRVSRRGEGRGKGAPAPGAPSASAGLV